MRPARPLSVTDARPFTLSECLSVLLTSGWSGGTIAAVRNLGRNGVNVGIISSKRLCAAAWSRCVSRVYAGPPESESQAFLERLLEIGAANPGQVLLATSDMTAWLYTVNASQLEQHFCLYQPAIDGMRRILDKKLFADAAANAGLAVLPCWDPCDIDDLSELAPTLPYPILIKPRTHVHRLRTDKGIIVNSKTELIHEYQSFVVREQAAAVSNAVLPNVSRPILQKFVRVASEGVHSITGFIDRTGDLFVTRHSTKIFQRSPPLGIGICFELLPAIPLLSDAVHCLCREIGYFGIFEVEFLWFDGSWTVIDFNPRMFHQIGMDIARGAPLPLLACLDAAGESVALRNAVEKANAEDEDRKVVFVDRFLFRMFVLAQTIRSRMSPNDRAYWRAWKRKNASWTVDVVADGSDLFPGFIHVLSEIYFGLKGIPRFWRSRPSVSVSAKTREAP